MTQKTVARSYHGVGERMTVKEAKQKIQDLIDRLPDEDFIECLEEMIDLAQMSLDARKEEIEDQK